MRQTIALILLLLGFQTVWGESSVWKAQKNGKEIFIGGTVHVLRQSDYPLPQEFLETYKNTDVLVLEVNVAETDRQEMGNYILENGTYRDGTTLKSVLSPDVYGKLSEYCEQAGLPMAALNSYKPSIVMMTLLSLKFQQLGASTGVDQYFYHQSVRDGKKILGLETANRQLEVIIKMGEGNEDDFILSSLHDMESMESTLDDLIRFWKDGDETKLYEYYVKTMAREFPELYRDLLVQRNKAWLPVIEKFFQSKEKEFVLVGAAHLVGPDGILAMLQAAGYSVEKVKTGGDSKEEEKKETKTSWALRPEFYALKIQATVSST